MNRDKVIEMILDPGRRPLEGTAEQRAFLAYLEGSPECRAMYEQQEVVWEALDLWEPVEPSVGFDRQVYQKIEQSRTIGLAGVWGWLSGPGVWFAGMRPRLAAALAALLLIAGTIVSYQPRPGIDTVALGPSGVDSEYIEQIDQTLDDIEMLADFDALVLQPEGPGQS